MKRTTKIGLSSVIGIAIIGTTGILTQIGLRYQTQHNLSNYNTKLEDINETDINKYSLKEVNENTLLKLVNGDVNENMETSLIAIKDSSSNANKYELLLKNKADSLVKELYSNEINLKDLYSNEESHYDNLTASQKAYVNSIINSKKEQINDEHFNELNSKFYFSPTSFSFATISNSSGGEQYVMTNIENQVGQWQSELNSDTKKWMILQ